MCWRNVMATGSLDAGAVQAAFESSTRSGSASENAPLVRWPGSDTLSVALSAVEMTSAEVVATYSRSTPGVNAPNDTGPPTASASVAGTVPPTPPPAARASFAVKNGTANATI